MNSSLQCTPVSGRRDQKAFLQFEIDLYRNNPHWIPPLWDERKRLVGFKPHPFYLDAEATAFLVRRGDRVVGRVVAIINHAHNRRYQEKRGFFGFYECEKDPEASALLLATAEEHLRTKGMTDVRGPVHPSLNYECGMLVEGFDRPPTFLIPYNHSYYDELVRGSGYEKVQDLYSYEAHMDLLNDLDPKLKFVVDEATKRFKVVCRPLSRKNFKRDVRIFLDIYNQSLQQTWGYVPMSEAEVDSQGKSLQYLLVPELTSIAEIDGKPVGAGFGLLDFNEAIGKIGGHLFPFGWITLLMSKSKIKRLRLISTNVLPEYQKWGLGLVTLARLLPDAIARGLENAEFSWVLESNSLSRGTIERGGAQRFKVHRIYDKKLS
jgi:GNAT superfamily N-acetyltransferase